MKSIKVLPLFIVLFFTGINTFYSQSNVDNLTEGQKAEIKKNLEEYAAVLDLSEDQEPKFQEITKKYAKQMIAVKDSDERRMSKFKKVKSIRKDKDAEMKTLLSKEQYKIYLEKQEEMKKRINERR